MNIQKKLQPLQTKLQQLSEVESLRPFKTLFETAEGIIFGVRDVTAEAPHFLDHIELKRYMGMVLLSLLPTTFAAIYFFGWPAIQIIVASYVAGGLVEVTFALIRNKDIEEGFLVTGLIFPLTLPPTTPLWVVMVGSAFGVFFGKEVFGGTGRNIFNPALVGRLFITIAFPQIMSTAWQAPFTDTVTSATPLSVYKSARAIPAIMDLVLGQTTGSMGELFRLGIVVGGIFLMVTKVSNWRVPVSYLASVFVLAGVGTIFMPAQIAGPGFQLISGGLLFGAMFMATDPVTSPFTNSGKYIFGISCGLLTVLIRAFSGYTEGVMFSIICMNALAPLIDHSILRFKYRTAKP
ncbi:RnfABCDGE type electron transport complex subunit D [candidate division KSB3 bacterium]|uniref:Ion-translocating oxidoreductase complex subunit D n=1 Tax=candidate division KSB3 bacterium TaxID=2044937 RepID=A0A9D5JT90_9BACT|nr:RnfABCDGE type electron transport complex subunit D [candidate division KSB3 bacterium]MBD3323557.1 RnfABCDGE type electron transport complex subunit D [candidate division KSB3 bacterium]